ncbi:MAG: hypothetical protein H7Z11_06455 [Verrucomicrobia bacterium]|nr:hypothetical protein [Leptolyngbya sp. ES-bin-22]
MTVPQPRYSKEEFARRGDELYETQVRAQGEAGWQDYCGDLPRIIVDAVGGEDEQAST